jgi:hypothetical protein
MFTKNFYSSRAIVAALAAVSLVFGLAQPASATATTTMVGAMINQSGGSNTAGSSAVDSAGNLYIVGWQGNNDSFITKFSSARTLVWRKTFVSTDGAGIEDLAIDPSGVLVATGWFCGAFDLGAFGTRNSIGNCDGYVMKVDSAGNSTAFRSWGEPGAWAGSSGIAIDGGGNIFIAAEINIPTQGVVGIEGITWTQSLNQAGDTYGNAIIKYNNNLQVQYVKPLPSGFTITHWPNVLTASPSGRLLIAGSFAHTADFGSAGVVTAVGNTPDAVWLEFDTQGNIAKLKSYPGNGYDYAWGVSYDQAGNIYVLLDYEQNITIGSTTLPAGADTRIAVVKYDATTTNQLWMQTFNAGSGYVYGFNLVVDPAGNVVVSGNFSHTMTVGSAGTFTANVSSPSLSEMFMIGLNPDGTTAWARVTQSSFGDNWAVGRPALVGSNFYLCGTLRGDIDFGDNVTLTSTADVYESFVAKLSITWNVTTPMPVNPAYGTPASSNSSVTSATTLPPVQFTSISPRVIDSETGASVTVSGSNMSKVTSVKMDATSLTFKLVGDQLQIIVPAHAVGSADLTFTTSDGAVPLSNAVQFSDVLNTHLAVITLVNPTKAALEKAQAKFAKIIYTDRVVTKGKKPKVTITLTGRVKN